MCWISNSDNSYNHMVVLWYQAQVAYDKLELHYCSADHIYKHLYTITAWYLFLNLRFGMK